MSVTSMTSRNTPSVKCTTKESGYAPLTISTQFVSLIVLCILLFDLTYMVSGSDSSIYTSINTGKRVVSRPAMRINHVRRPMPSVRRRIIIQRRPPIITSRRPAMSTGSSIPGLLPRISIIKEPEIISRTRTKPSLIQTTVSVAAEGNINNVTGIPASASTNSAGNVHAIPSKSVEIAQETTPRTPQTTSYERQSKLRSYSRAHALRRMNKDIDYPDLLKKLDYFMSYYPTVREAAARMRIMLTKHEQTSREDNRRLWKGVYRVKSDLRNLRARCDGMYRNVSTLIAKTRRHAHEFMGYKKNAKQKIDQIEMHQETQDLQHFEVYERSLNNSKHMQSLQEEILLLFPLVTEMARNQEMNTLLEKRALKQLDSHARLNIAEMTNQLLVQQNTLANLGDQVRSEMNTLHAEKQTMAKRMEQQSRKLTETMNFQLSTHLRKIDNLDGTLNRQVENVKSIASQVMVHDELLQSNGAMGQTYRAEIDTVSEKLSSLKTNITDIGQKYENFASNLMWNSNLLRRLNNETSTMYSTLRDQRTILVGAVGRLNVTQDEMKAISEELRAHMRRQRIENDEIRDNVTRIEKKQELQALNITAISGRYRGNRVTQISQYPSDEPAPESTSVTPQELKSLLTEIGVEDRMSRLTRVLRHQQQRMSNVTKAVLRIAEDNEAIAMTTSHYFTLINAQAKLILDQNETINNLALIAATQGDTINSLSIELSNEQETVIRLTNILKSLATKANSPMGSQRDCHDVWLNGNRKSGVYNIIESVHLRPVYCNITEYGGWTVIQRRKDGSFDFNRNMKEYENGFGDVYGEYWLGLETIKSLTQRVRASVALQIVLEDTTGNRLYATYSRFYLYGPGYNIAIDGFTGDAGDALSSVNGRPFSASSDNGHDWTSDSCPYTRKAGWWFAPSQNGCGEANPNGQYQRVKTPGVPSHSSIYWKQRSELTQPIRCVTMQVMPTDIFLRNAEKNSQTEQVVNEEIDGKSAGKAFDSNLVQSNPGLGNYQSKFFSSYEADLREAGIAEAGIHPDYDNIDYNSLLVDG